MLSKHLDNLKIIFHEIGGVCIIEIFLVGTWESKNLHGSDN